MHTKDKLARELRLVGLPRMAVKAECGYYDDYLSPLAFPMMQLADELRQSGTPPALALRKRVLEGEFDATNAEAQAWAESPEGQKTFNEVFKRPRP